MSEQRVHECKAPKEEGEKGCGAGSRSACLQSKSREL